MATRGGGTGSEDGWSALGGLPDLGDHVLSASAAVAYVAVGAAVILSRTLTEAAQDALTWRLPRTGAPQRKHEGRPKG